MAIKLRLVPKVKSLQERVNELESMFEMRPSVKLAESIVVMLQENGVPKSEWQQGALLGYFFRTYSRQFGVPYSAKSEAEIREGLVGIMEALEYLTPLKIAQCVDALFGPDMEWASTKSLSMLAKKSNRDRFLIPIVAKAQKQSKGEFSEFAGTRSDTWSVKKL